MEMFKTLQLIFLGFSFSSALFTTLMCYRLMKIPEVPTSVWKYWTIFFGGRLISFAGSVFFLVQLDMSRSLFGNYVTITSWIYSSILSLIALTAVAKTYKKIIKKFPWNL